MGEILDVKTAKNNKIIVKIILQQKEAQLLKNNFKNIYLFPEETCTHTTRILEKGTQKSAKYFLIPLSLKSRKKPRYTKITYQKIETKSQVFFIAIATKNILYSEL